MTGGRRSGGRVSVAEAVTLAAAFGVVTGLGEVGFAASRKYLRHLFVFQPPDLAWMAPVAEAVIFVALAVVWLGGASLVRRRPTQSQATGAGAAAAVFTLLLLLPPLHPAASLLLAIGVGVRVASVGLTAAPAVVTAARRLTGGVAPLLLLVGIGIHLVPAIRERRAVGALPAPPPNAPNVLLVILDTVRAWNLSLYGYSRPTTPGLARWAARGTRFETAQSTAPWTLPSHASIFTGHQAHDLSTDWYVALDDRYPTVAAVLAGRGYLTAGFTANLPYTNREVGLARGFQHYEDWPFTAGSILVSSALVRAVTTNDWIRDRIGTKELVVRKDAPRIHRDFLAWLDRRAERPFFAFLNYYDAHTPYVPPEPFRSEFAPRGAPFFSDLPRRATDEPWNPETIQGAVNAYDGAIRSLDFHLDRLLSELERRGLLENTVVVITADHGEEFAEHGLFSHGNSLYLGSLQVPLLIIGPGVAPGTVISTPVSLADLPATIGDLTGLGGSTPFPGRSLRRRWEDSTAAPEVLFAEVRHAPKLPAWYPSTRGDVVAARVGSLRFIANSDGTEELFDVATDSLEQRDLSRDPARRDQVERLRALVDSARTAGLASRKR